MGEYADMMLEGVCCACCGTYLDDGMDDGFPRYCSTACEPIGYRDEPAPKPRKTSFLKKEPCPQCGKRVKGMAQHIRDAHVRPTKSKGTQND